MLTQIKTALRNLASTSLTAVAMASALTSTGCALNPATGMPNLVMMSENTEVEKGKELHQKVLAGMPIYQDQKLQAYVASVGQRIVKNSDRSDIDYFFTVIDSPDINAFALPGGYIYINRGLIAYLSNEAQLAAVLAHEIGHVTARHAVRQDAARKGASVGTAAVSVFSVLTTGSTALGDVTGLLGSAAVTGYGREMELEADHFGARYLFNAGYDPQAMAQVIGVLKDHEQFSRRRARELGKPAQNYHGLFSTHPRNDVRLQEVIAEAGTLPKNKVITNTDVFRQHTEGLIYGINPQAGIASSKTHNDYTHPRLGFTLRYPQNWQVQNTRSAIIAAPADMHAQMNLTVGILREPMPAEAYLRKQFNVTLLRQSEAFQQHHLTGHTGIIPAADNKSQPRRVAVLYQGNRVYSLECRVSKPQQGIDYDQLCLDTLHSFRPVRPTAGTSAPAKTIHYVKANTSTTFARLAQHVNLGKYGEEQLRLLNGYYPSGEPKPGEWLKIVK